MKKALLFLTLSLILNFNFYGQETYKIGDTEYYSGQYYSTTGKPRVKRSDANKKKFLKSLGYNEIPYGYQIDHIKPLSEGGTDNPRNMQLLTVAQHKQKTARERKNRSNSSYPRTPRKYYSNSTYSSQYNKYSSSKSNHSVIDNKGRSIYTGSKGGKYYLNGKGKKVYVKAKKSSSSRNYLSPTFSSPKYSAPSSPQSRAIRTGPRGGKYYINSNGNKTYIKK